MKHENDYRTRDYKKLKPDAASKVTNRNRQRKIFFSDISEEKKEIYFGRRAYKRMVIETENRRRITERAYGYEKLMKKYLCNFTRDFNLIEDIIQDVYFRLMTEPATLTIQYFNDERFRRLCFTKAKQSFINIKNKMDHCRRETLVEPVPYIEKERYTVFDTHSSQLESPIDKMQYEWLKTELEASIAAMPEETQAALRLYFAGAEIREVCYELRMNQNVYKSIREKYIPKVVQLMEQKIDRCTKSNEIRMMH